MKTSIIFLLILLTSPCFASEPQTNWSTQDTVLQLAFVSLLELDREQTVWSSKHPYTYEYTVTQIPNGVAFNKYSISHTESNPIIGNNASVGKINGYFASVAIVHTAISYGLRKSGWNLFGVPLVTIWQGVNIGIEGVVVGRNISVGTKFSFN